MTMEESDEPALKYPTEEITPKGSDTASGSTLSSRDPKAMKVLVVICQKTGYRKVVNKFDTEYSTEDELLKGSKKLQVLPRKHSIGINRSGLKATS